MKSLASNPSARAPLLREAFDSGSLARLEKFFDDEASYYGESENAFNSLLNETRDCRPVESFLSLCCGRSKGELTEMFGSPDDALLGIKRCIELRASLLVGVKVATQVGLALDDATLIEAVLSSYPDKSDNPELMDLFLCLAGC